MFESTHEDSLDHHDPSPKHWYIRERVGQHAYDKVAEVTLGIKVRAPFILVIGLGSAPKFSKKTTRHGADVQKENACKLRKTHDAKGI